MTTAGKSNVRTDPAFVRLEKKHDEYDQKLTELRSQRYLSGEEKLEEVRLKKKKLELKDKMEAILNEVTG